MRYSSMIKMAEFAVKYDQDGKTVIDIGSLDTNGSYRKLFPKSTYIGVDIILGANVDIIMDSQEWDDLKDIDMVISGQTLQQVEDIPKLMTSIFDVLKTDGVICLIAPSGGSRKSISKERMIEVLSDAGFKILSCDTHPIGPWRDNCCIAIKMKKKRSRSVTTDK